MSIQNEYLIPFYANSKSEQIPIEAELAYVVGVAGDRVKKSGLFKKVKEDLTLVSKFYWRIFIDTIESRLILVDSLGLYGNGTGIDDLSITSVEANLRAMKDSTSINAFTESLVDANGTLILSANSYSVFDEEFTKSILELIKNNLYQGNVDSPLILPTFDNRINKTFVDSLREINRFVEIQDEIRDLSNRWLGDINDKIKSIESEYAQKITNTQSDVEKRLVGYEERLNTQIDSDLQKANQAIYRALTKFEGSTLGLTGIISPIQEESRKILQNLPSTETPKFNEAVQKFLDKSKNQIAGITNKVKELESERRQLEKDLQAISQTHSNNKQKAVEEYETNKGKALTEVDRLREKRDEALSTLVELRDTIKKTTDELLKKIEQVIQNRKFLAKTSTSGQSGNAPENFLISLYLIRFQEKDKIRYFVVPPLIPTRKNSPDFQTPEMDSAIKGAKNVMDKIVAELVFGRKLKESFDALLNANYIATGEIGGAIKQGLEYLSNKKLISKKALKQITETINDFNL
ncbi:MAG: hypothetical protein ACFFDW_08855 [Candidatus Thorarchaeota archaeon]